VALGHPARTHPQHRGNSGIRRLQGNTSHSAARAEPTSVFATGGHELGLCKGTLDLLAAPAIPASHGFTTNASRAMACSFSLGFMKSSGAWPFGSPASFGSPGSGGSLGFADTSSGVGYSYVTSKIGTALTGEPRDMALRNALYSAIAVLEDTKRTKPQAA